MQNGTTSHEPQPESYREGQPRKVQLQRNSTLEVADVYRDITSWLLEQRNVSKSQLADELGYSHSTISRFLNGKPDDTGEFRDHDLRMDYITKLSAWSGLNHVELLQLHPALRPNPGDAGLRADAHARLLQLLTTSEALALVSVLQEAKQRGVLELAFESIELVLRAGAYNAPADPTPRRGT